jgi:HK97 family phage major capsid protein
MKINFDGKILAADTETRVIRGMVVPFGKVGNTSAGAVSFEFGAFNEIKAENIILNREHVSTNVLGRGIAGSEEITPAGINMAFKIAPTTAGTDALIEAAEGLRPSFSIEASADEYTIDKGVMKVSKATLTAVAHVTRPAFVDANILEVAASEDDEETPETTEAAAEENQEGTTMENENPEVEAAEVEAVTPVVQAAAPIRTAPRSPIVDSASYLEHTIKAAMGNHDSVTYVKAADESTTTNTGLTLAPHLTEFISDTIFGRPTIDAISGGALPASGMSFTLPRLTQAPSVAAVAEEGDPFGTAMTSDFITVDVAKYAGASIVSYELIDRSSPAFLTELLRELSSAYAKATDLAVVTALLSGGTDATEVAGDADGLQSFIATESAAAYAGSGNFARNLVANSTNWAAIMGYQDGAQRPLYMASAPQNAPGAVNGTSIVGNVLGTSLYVDPHIGSGADEGMILIAPEAATWYESPVRQVRAEAIGTGQIEISLYGYGAIALKKPLGIRVYQQSA